MKFTGVMLNSHQPKVLADFYTSVFGEPKWEMDGWTGYEVGDGNLMIGFHSEVSGVSKEPARQMITFETDDVKADFDRIKGAGAGVVAEPYQPDADSMSGFWLATLSDPDGNYIQLASPWVE